MADTGYGHPAAIPGTGTALLIVEPKVHHTLELCNHVVVLRRGSSTGGGDLGGPLVLSDLTGDLAAEG